MRLLLSNLKQYIHDTLATSITLDEWSESKRLPFFLQENYTFYQVQFLGLNCLMMADTRDHEESPAVIRKHMDQVRAKWAGEIIYVRDRVTAYNRKRLIEHSLPFIVPGNQLYLPMLAIDLREHFRQKREISEYFYPSTQALVLYWIYNDQNARVYTPTELARVLGYSKMTMTRAFREVEPILKDALLNDEQGALGVYSLNSRELWERTHPFMRSPAKKRIYVSDFDIDRHIGHRAGLFALADYSMLAKPKNMVWAVSQEEWKTLQQKHQFHVLDSSDQQAMEIEIWSYAPSLFGHDGLVDRLSLYLSLQQDNHDERVEVALDQLVEGMQW